MRYILKFVLVISLVASSSLALASTYTLQTLPSGRKIKILGIGKMFFSKDEPALMLKYQTDNDIDKIDLIRQEAEEIWPIFRVNVENFGLSNAIISAIETPKKKLLILSTSRSYNFLISKKQNGSWGFSSSWKRNYDTEAKKLASQYFGFVMNGHITEAAHVLKYPDYFTPDELKEDIRGVSKALQIVTQEYGSILNYQESKSDAPYYYAGVQGGSTEYWEKHPFFMRLLYDVDFSEKANGHVILIYSIINEELVLSTVLYALPVSVSGSKEKMEHVLSRFRNEIQ
jgi:hypothetical protein